MRAVVDGTLGNLALLAAFGPACSAHQQDQGVHPQSCKSFQCISVRSRQQSQIELAEYVFEVLAVT